MTELKYKITIQMNTFGYISLKQLIGKLSIIFLLGLDEKINQTTKNDIETR